MEKGEGGGEGEGEAALHATPVPSSRTRRSSRARPSCPPTRTAMRYSPSRTRRSSRARPCRATPLSLIDI